MVNVLLHQDRYLDGVYRSAGEVVQMPQERFEKLRKGTASVVEDHEVQDLVAQHQARISMAAAEGFILPGGAA